MGRGARQTTLAHVRLALLAVWLAALAVGLGQAPPVQGAAAANADDEIAYIDPDGYIHVIDPEPSSPLYQVQWVSPEGGWTQLALGDFNADGDAEIVAARPVDSGGELAIYDPVARNVVADHARFVAGVPWDLLYTTSTSTPIRALASGEFDLASPGDEILYSRFLPEPERRVDDHRGRVTLLRPVTGSAGGREWEQMVNYDSEYDWTWAASGNVDGAGEDEVALVDDNSGSLAVLRVNHANKILDEFYRNVNRDHTWRQVAIGQFRAGGPAEVAAVRDAEFPLPAFWVFRYENGGLVDDLWEAFLPSPHVVFLGDLGGNGDDEALILRSVRPEAGARPRLIVRDSGNDPLVLREALLDGDNGYQAGAAGDVDGDGHDEIVLMRDFRIRIYTEAEESARFMELAATTNSADLALGNVDANGIASAPQLGASTMQVAIHQGPNELGEPVTIAVMDIANGDALPVTVRRERSSDWLEVTPSSSVTPFDLTVRIDSRGLDAGVYRDRIVVDAQMGGVVDDPLVIEVTLSVETGVMAVPRVVVFDYYPCEEPLEVQSRPVALEGDTEVPFSATIQDEPAWLVATPSEGSVPDVVTLTADPALRPNDFARATLVLTLDLPDAPGTVQRVPVVLLCASRRLYLPHVTARSP